MSNTLRKNKNPYGSSPRKLLEDKNISLKAKGIYAFMECKIDGWNFTASSMATQLKESRKTILAAMQELKATGWLTYHKNKDGSGVYELIGNYVISPKSENDTMALQSHSPKTARCKKRTVLIRRITLIRMIYLIRIINTSKSNLMRLKISNLTQ